MKPSKLTAFLDGTDELAVGLHNFDSLGTLDVVMLMNSFIQILEETLLRVNMWTQM